MVLIIIYFLSHPELFGFSNMKSSYRNYIYFFYIQYKTQFDPYVLRTYVLNGFKLKTFIIDIFIINFQYQMIYIYIYIYLKKNIEERLKFYSVHYFQQFKNLTMHVSEFYPFFYI